MARGGGTGSRNNKKKKTADVVPQNGSVEVSRPLKAPQANGGATDNDVANINKHKNKHNRKQKEETPPTLAADEETKDEKTKLVPTSEQLRLAQITQSQDNSMDPQRKAKISQVIDITGKSEDEVATALFDCGWDPTKAIEMLLDEGGTGGMGSWEETGKKKKKKNQEEEKAGKENEDWNDEFDPNNKFDDNRERSRQRAPPRLRNRGGGSQGVSREEQGAWKQRENQENDRNNFEGGRGRGRGGLGPRGRGGAVGGRGPVGGQRGGRGGGPRGFSDRGPVDPRVVERREGGGGGAGCQSESRGGESSFGQMETWNPVGEVSSGSGPQGPGPVQQPGTGTDLQRQRSRPSNKDAFDNAGNWGDDFPAAEDWDNDEYTGSLSDTKVFTPSGAAGPKSAIGEPVNVDSRNSVTSHPSPATNTQPTQPANNSLSGSSYSQPIDLSKLLQSSGALSVAPGGPTTLSQYQQAATKDLKSAIGLAPGQGSLSYSSNSGNSSFASAAPGSAFSPIKPAAVTNGSNAGSKALPRARLPPPSKIPSSAVEMPGDSLSNLDVQFGGLDLQFGGSNNDTNSSNFDFSGGTPPSQKQELEERYSIPSAQPGQPEPVGQPTTLDSYKTQVPSQAGVVKDPVQTLSSALVSAGIKASSSTDSVPGYGRVGERESSTSSSRPGDTKPQYGQNTQQRSPGPLLAKAETLGYNNGPSYTAYQGTKANQGFPSTGGYPGTGFERQQSSGYSNSNGLSSSGYGSSGSSGYNPPREASYSNTSYGGGSTTNNFGGYGGGSGGSGGGGGTNTTNYSPYAANNSYSSSGKSSQQSSQSQYAPVSTTSGPNSQYPDSTSAGSKSSYDTPQTSTSSVSGYGGVGQPSTGSSVTGLGLGSGNSMVSSSSKMSVNTTSGKMVPGMPPGVAGVLPAQYMIGANAAAGFPYLAGLGQAPAMAPYPYSGHQLEDLAALQRSTLAASLPQLPNSGYYDPSNQFGAGSGGAGSLASRQNDPTSSFPSETSGKFGSGGDSTSSPVPSSVAQSQQPTPFNALASTFAAAAPQQHPTLPPGYAYFYGGVGGMAGAQLAAAAYGGGLQAGGVAGYPATHPGIPAPTVAGPTSSTQFQNKAYGSSYGTSYGESLSGLQQSTGYSKNSYGQSDSQAKSGNSSNTAGHGYWSSSNGLW